MNIEKWKIKMLQNSNLTRISGEALYSAECVNFVSKKRIGKL